MAYYYNLADFFKSIALNYNNHPAIKYADAIYTYQQVETDANRLAGFLSNQGFHRGDVIAIINDKQYITYVLMLACLKIGVIYTNIDPDAPANWIASIIECCNPKMIVSIENYTAFTDILAKEPTVTIEHNPQLDGNTIAYIMFTSGSTGKPKGVAVTHQNLWHFIHWGIARYEVGVGDIFANVSPMYFDNSVFDFYISLFSGACIAPINKHIISNPKKLIEYVTQLQCTIWFSVPSLLIFLNVSKVLTDNVLPNLRIITFGGEGYPKSELKKIYDRFKHRMTFVNVYGPTECTCICSSYTITDQDFATLDDLPSLGYMNPNFSFLILDEHNNQTTNGELCLLGPNVAVGYYNDPERTMANFTYYTGNGFYQAKMYKTGDLVKLENNLLYFIGRKDNQIKHMGYRIELEAIEIAIAKIADVNEVAVTYHRISTAYGKIIAYVASDNTNLTSNEIKSYLQNELPVYMIPNQFKFFTVLPKNANGKIDKATLKGLMDVVVPPPCPSPTRGEAQGGG